MVFRYLFYVCFLAFCFVYEFTDYCHRMETPLQLVNIISCHITSMPAVLGASRGVALFCHCLQGGLFRNISTIAPLWTASLPVVMLFVDNNASRMQPGKIFAKKGVTYVVIQKETDGGEHI